MPIVPTPPDTVVQSTHALVVRAKGTIIGAINAWRDNMERPTTPLFEFGNVSGRYTQESPHSQVSGTPFEQMPQNNSNQTITVQRYELYEAPFEEAFGTNDITMLNMQLAALDLEESWVTPSNEGNYRNVYRGSWFTSRARNFEAGAAREVNTNIGVNYTTKVKLFV